MRLLIGFMPFFYGHACLSIFRLNFHIPIILHSILGYVVFVFVRGIASYSIALIVLDLPHLPGIVSALGSLFCSREKYFVL